MSERRSWFSVDGGLEPIHAAGDTDSRFPEAVAEHIIERYSGPGDWVLDPFCGFGTALVVAERLGRNAVGVEIDAARAEFSASRVTDRSRVVHSNCEALEPGRWPPFQLLVTSPPYGSFRDASLVDAGDDYVRDASRIFAHLRRFLAPHAVVAVEVAQEREGSVTRPLVWRIGAALSSLFVLQDDVVRVNTGAADASLGYQHSHILVFRNDSPEEL